MSGPKTMHVLVDAHMLGEQEGGNETYIAGLLRGLASPGGPDDIRVTALCHPEQATQPFFNTRLRAEALRAGGNFQRVFGQIPALCRRLRADMVHMTYNASPFLSCPLALTVHDVIFRRDPGYFSPRVRLLLNTLLPLSLWRAAVVVTDSTASRREIEHFYPFVRDKVHVIPIGSGPVACVTPDSSNIERYAQARDYVLAVGTVQPRKNLARLIEAYISLRERGATNARLVIVGRSIAHTRRILCSPVILRKPLSPRFFECARLLCARRYTRASAFHRWKQWPAAVPPLRRMSPRCRKSWVMRPCWLIRSMWKRLRKPCAVY